MIFIVHHFETDVYTEKKNVNSNDMIISNEQM